MRRRFLKQIASAAAVAASVTMEQFIGSTVIHGDTEDLPVPIQQVSLMSPVLQALTNQNEAQKEWERAFPDEQPYMFNGTFTNSRDIGVGVAAAVARFARSQEGFDNPTQRKPMTKELFMSAAGWRK